MSNLLTFLLSYLHWEHDGQCVSSFTLPLSLTCNCVMRWHGCRLLQLTPPVFLDFIDRVKSTPKNHCLSSSYSTRLVWQSAAVTTGVRWQLSQFMTSSLQPTCCYWKRTKQSAIYMQFCAAHSLIHPVDFRGIRLKSAGFYDHVEHNCTP